MRDPRSFHTLTFSNAQSLSMGTTLCAVKPCVKSSGFLWQDARGLSWTVPSELPKCTPWFGCLFGAQLASCAFPNHIPIQVAESTLPCSPTRDQGGVQARAKQLDARSFLEESKWNTNDAGMGGASRLQLLLLGCIWTRPASAAFLEGKAGVRANRLDINTRPARPWFCTTLKCRFWAFIIRPMGISFFEQVAGCCLSAITVNLRAWFGQPFWELCAGQDAHL